MNTDTDFTQIGDDYHVQPDTYVKEADDYIGKLQQAQAQENARIGQETHALGTDVPYTQGGLQGAEGTWQTRYQTPAENVLEAGLRKTAQQNALNQLMENLLAMKKDEYAKAYKKAANKPKAAAATKKGKVNVTNPKKTPDATAKVWLQGYGTDKEGSNLPSGATGSTVISPDPNGETFTTFEDDNGNRVGGTLVTNVTTGKERTITPKNNVVPNSMNTYSIKGKK